MEFDNSFEVPLPPEQAWATLMEIEKIAPCMPGAELTELVDDRTFKGKVSVRLGPVALTFQGQAHFEDLDSEAHKAVIKAQGTDAKGRGGAQATVDFALEPSDTGSRVNIHTDMQLSGSVAQYGRGVGMIKDLASRIIDQFAENLASRIETSGPAAAQPEEVAAEAEARPDPPQPAAPAQVGGMALKVLWARMVQALRSLFVGSR